MVRSLLVLSLLAVALAVPDFCFTVSCATPAATGQNKCLRVFPGNKTIEVYKQSDACAADMYCNSYLYMQMFPQASFAYKADGQSTVAVTSEAVFGCKSETNVLADQKQLLKLPTEQSCKNEQDWKDSCDRWSWKKGNNTNLPDIPLFKTCTSNTDCPDWRQCFNYSSYKLDATCTKYLDCQCSLDGNAYCQPGEYINEGYAFRNDECALSYTDYCKVKKYNFPFNGLAAVVNFEKRANFACVSDWHGYDALATLVEQIYALTSDFQAWRNAYTANGYLLALPLLYAFMA